MITFFFFNDTATTEIYTLSLHDALPISLVLLPFDRRNLIGAKAIKFVQASGRKLPFGVGRFEDFLHVLKFGLALDRKSTRLNSSHANISYAVFCLKKKNISIMCVYSRLA